MSSPLFMIDAYFSSPVVVLVCGKKSEKMARRPTGALFARKQTRLTLSRLTQELKRRRRNMESLARSAKDSRPRVGRAERGTGATRSANSRPRVLTRRERLGRGTCHHSRRDLPSRRRPWHLQSRPLTFCCNTFSHYVLKQWLCSNFGGSSCWHCRV
jgi:hypothetical protein